MLSVSAGDIDIAYREAGSGDPVLLINGTGESGATWQRQIEALAARWRCIAIDNRDTGRSTYVETTYTPREMASDVAAVIDALDLGPCHIVGYSLGGATAQEVALARPDLVRSIVLLSTWARSDPWFVAQMRNWQSIRLAHLDDEGAFVRALAPWCYAPATFAMTGRVDAIEAWLAEIEPRAQRSDGWMRQTEADIAHDAAERLHEVRAPALIVVGDDDICTPPRYSTELARLLPRSELVSIPDTGHCALFEDPSAVDAALVGFLSRH